MVTIHRLKELCTSHWLILRLGILMSRVLSRTQLYPHNSVMVLYIHEKYWVHESTILPMGFLLEILWKISACVFNCVASFQCLLWWSEQGWLGLSLGFVVFFWIDSCPMFLQVPWWNVSLCRQLRHWEGSFPACCVTWELSKQLTVWPFPGHRIRGV